MVLGATVDNQVIHKLQTGEEVRVIVFLNEDANEKGGIQQLGIPRIPGIPDIQQQEIRKKASFHQVREEVLHDLLVSPADRYPVADRSPVIQSSEQKDDSVTDFILQREYASVPAFSGIITPSGLEKLQGDSRVKSIQYDRLLGVSLTTSVPQIKANPVWNLSASGYNITGSGETICIVDTGIDTDHPAFQNKIIAQYCYCSLGGGCCAGSTSEASTAEDDQGHGTHVAGIAMGNLSTHPGIAKDAKVVMIKACNNASSASCATSDVISGIDWCSTNATKYNISVISLSLGGGSANNAYCNGESLAAPINTAVGKNISVVVAAGNNGFTNGISIPACVQNATPVGAVDASDGVLYNRGILLDILAPGSGIVSANFDGGTVSKSGTSMATPHVSGAIALLHQYYRLVHSREPSPDELKRKMIWTGKFIDDSSGSGRNYSRLDLLQAIRPFLNYTAASTVNNSFFNHNTTLINITSDVRLTNITIEWSYSNGSVRNFTLNRLNDTSFFLNVTGLVEGVDTYQVHGNDSINTTGTSSLRTVTIDWTLPAVSFASPNNGSNFSSGTQGWNATIQEKYIQQVLLSFDNASGTGFNVTASNNSGNWNANVDLLRLGEGLHTVTVLSNDSAGNANATSFISFSVDRTPPTVTFITLVERNFTIRSNLQVFNITVTDAVLSPEAVLFHFNNATGKSLNITATNGSGSWAASVNVSAFTEGKHTLTVLANDTLNNRNWTESITFTVDSTPPEVSWNTPASSSKFILSSSNQTFNITVRDRNLTVEAILFSFDNASGTGFNVTAVNKSGYWSASYNVSALADGTHIVTLLANDTMNNRNTTETLMFTVDITTPLVTLNSPGNLSNSSTSVTFNCSAQDNGAIANITLYGNWSTGWHGNQTKGVNGTSNETTFSKSLVDGRYAWNCEVRDTEGNMGFASANYTLIIDSQKPIISSVSAGSIASTSATISWTSSELANSSVNYGTAESLGTRNTGTSWVTSHSRSLSGLTASSIYYYNVTSCDVAGNCQVNGSFTFTTTASSSGDSGGSSGSSGGSGGGGGSSSTSSNATETTSAEQASSDSSAAEASSAELAAAESLIVLPAVPIPVSGLFQLIAGQTAELRFTDTTLAFTKVEIKSKIDKEVSIEAVPLSNPPENTFAENTFALSSVYQYVEIKAALTAEEIDAGIDDITIQFTVPVTWLEEQKADVEDISLYLYEEEDKEWKRLRTSLVGEGNPQLYEARIPHFSLFAIVVKESRGALFGGAVIGLAKRILAEGFGMSEILLIGLAVLIVLLAGVYFLLREKER